MQLGGVFTVLMAAAAVSTATPVCELSSVFNMANCVMPMMAYVTLDPEGQQISKSKDGLDITEPQLRNLCNKFRNAVSCVQNVSAPCTSGNPELVETLNGAMSLLEVCDRPDLHSKTRLLLQCQQTLNQTAGTKTRACAHKAFRELKQIKASSESDLLETFRTGKVLRKFCCIAKASYECGGTEVADHCTPEAQQTVQAVRAALLETFMCNEPRGDRCPPSGPLTTEDLQWSGDMQSAFAGLKDSSEEVN